MAVPGSGLMLGMMGNSSPSAGGSEMEDSDEGLDSCAARGGKVVTFPDGTKKCVLPKSKEGCCEMENEEGD